MSLLLQVRVEIESLAPGVDLSEPLTRARFEELNADLFKKTLGPVRKVSSSIRPLPSDFSESIETWQPDVMCSCASHMAAACQSYSLLA